MGDRTWVEIYVLNESVPVVERILDDSAEIVEGGFITSFFFYEVNNGRMIEEEDHLTDMGIPYNYEWGTGDEYGSGTKYIRFTPEGELKHIEYFENDRNPSLEKLLELVSKPKELAEYVQQYADDITPLPWDNQVEYGKRYRARQLILANN